MKNGRGTNATTPTIFNIKKNRAKPTTKINTFTKGENGFFLFLTKISIVFNPIYNYSLHY
jgi:hypothetical protein